jgi:hypothetical protein
MPKPLLASLGGAPDAGFQFLEELGLFMNS